MAYVGEYDGAADADGHDADELKSKAFIFWDKTDRLIQNDTLKDYRKEKLTDISDHSDFFFLNGAASVKSAESVINIFRTQSLLSAKIRFKSKSSKLL